MEWLGLVGALLVLALLALRFTLRPYPELSRSEEDKPPEPVAQKPLRTYTNRLPSDSFPPCFVVFDLETTGLNARYHEIIEIGAIRVDDFNASTHKTIQMLVKPKRSIPKKITQMTGITKAMVDADGQPLAEAVKQFLELVGDLPLVAYNANFDMLFLEVAAMRLGLDVENESICALQAMRRAFPGRASYKLKDVAADAKLPCENLHRSLADCQRALMVYVAAAQKLSAAKKHASAH